MPTQVILPRVDMDMETGRIARWLAESGATINQGDPLFEIETDKATMEIDAPASGLLHILIDESATDLKIGTIIAEIRTPGEATPEPAPTIPTPPAPTPVRATPLARRQAALNRIDLTTIEGSGPRGRVISRDVERAAQLSIVPPTPTPTASHPASAPLHVVRSGGATGETIVYLHGFASSAASWAPLWAESAPDHPRLAIDLPGHGQSALRSSADPRTIATTVIDTIRHHVPGPIHLVGHSLGGALAGRIAAANLLDIRSILLIAPAGLGPEIDRDFIDGILRARTQASLQPWLNRIVADPSRLTHRMITSLLTQLTDPPRAHYLADLAASAFPNGTQSADWRLDLATLPMPTRILFGRHDRIIPAHQTDHITGAIAINRLDNSGHMPQIEQIALVARIHAELVRSAASSDATIGQIATSNQASRASDG